MSKPVHHLLIFSNGNVAAFDKSGGQVCSEQAPLLLSRFTDMVGRGVLPDDAVVETQILVMGKCKLTGKEIREWVEANK